MFNDSVWVDVQAKGEYTQREYFGRFRIKPYLTHKERADAVRLAEMYFRGINESVEQRQFLTALAFLKFHVVESDADWWNDESGLGLYDEAPVNELLNKLVKIQNPDKEKTNEVDSNPQV